MPRHTTKDPGQRASHVAEREVDEAIRRDLDALRKWPANELNLREQVLRELVEKPSK